MSEQSYSTNEMSNNIEKSPLTEETSEPSEPSELDVESELAPISTPQVLRMQAKKKAPSECSHKVIEKRRRDRINKCLADLGHIVPKAKGTGKLEKAEVLELTVDYIKKLQIANTNINKNIGTMTKANVEDLATKEQPTSCTKRELQSYTKGYSDCTNEVLHFMITVEATDPQLPCFQRLMAHLRNNCKLLTNFENGKKNHNSGSAASQKLHGQNKRSIINGDGQNEGPKTKRSRGKVENTNVTSNDHPKPPPSASGMTLEDKMKAVFKNVNGDSSSSSYNSNGSSSSYNGNRNGNSNSGDKTNGAPNPPSGYPPSLLPFANQGYPSQYGLPAYTLFPTQYIPVPFHPGMQMNGNQFGVSGFPAPMMAPGMGYLGSHLPGIPMGGPMGGPIGGLANPLSGLVPPYVSMGGIGGITSLKGPEGLPAYLAQDIKTKERSRESAQDSSGGSENDSSGDEYNFSTTSSSNLSEIGIKSDHRIDHSDYFSASSR